MLSWSKKSISILLTFLMLFLLAFPCSGMAAKSSCDARVEASSASAPKSIKITGSSVVAKGKKISLSASISPKGANQQVVWSSDQPKVATVSDKGVVTGKKAGTAKITAVSAVNKKVKKSFTVTVYAKAVKKISISGAIPLALSGGEKKVTLTASASPDKAAQVFEWKSSNSKVATVSDKGVVKAVGAGTVKIIAAALDGSGKKAEVEITVTEKPLDQKLVLWVKGGLMDLYAARIDAYLAKHPEYKGWTYELVDNGPNAGGEVAGMSEEDAPDVYTVAQDQLGTLRSSGCLSPVSGSQSGQDASALKGATFSGKVYAYPLSSDNGYFLYYDRSIVSNPGDLDAILRDCEAQDAVFGMELTSGWYQVAFFFGAGCTLDFTLNSSGSFSGVTCDFASANGLKALKAMIRTAASPAFRDTSSPGSVDGRIGAIVSGMWEASAMRELLGDNYATAKLPAFNGCQMGSYMGCTYLAVHPGSSAEKTELAHKIAALLTDKDTQVEAYKISNSIPSRKDARSAVALGAADSALGAQNQYAVPQGSVHGAYWGLASSLGADILDGLLTGESDASLMARLTAYQNSILGLAK